LGDHLHIGLVTAHPIITSTDSDAFQGKNPHFQQMSSPSTRDVWRINLQDKVKPA
jgi:hypothetical protein